MKILIFVLFTIFSMNALAGLECSDSSGTTRIVEWQRGGGPAPRIGEKMSSTQIYIQNNLVSESSTYYERESKEGPVMVDFNFATKHVFSGGGNGVRFIETYGIQMNLAANPRAPTPPDTKLPLSTYVMCTFTRFNNP